MAPRYCVCQAPRLHVLRELVALRVLASLPVVECSLLGELQARKMLAGDLHDHLAHDLNRTWVLPDYLDAPAAAAWRRRPSERSGRDGAQRVRRRASHGGYGVNRCRSTEVPALEGMGLWPIPRYQVWRSAPYYHCRRQSPLSLCESWETDVSKSRIDPKPTTDEHTVATSEPAAGGDSTVCVPPVVQLCGRGCRTSYRSHIANCMNAGEERSCVDVSHRAHVHEPRLVSMPQRHRSLRMLPVLLCRSRIPPART